MFKAQAWSLIFQERIFPRRVQMEMRKHLAYLSWWVRTFLSNFQTPLTPAHPQCPQNGSEDVGKQI